MQTHLAQIIRVHLVYILLLIIGQGSTPLLPTGWKKLQHFFITELSYAAWYL
jgi:hypothetical protein